MQGDLPAALASYQAGLAIATKLTQQDSSNTEWQHDLSVSYNKIGDVQLAQSDLAAALTSYRASHDIIDKLARADPGNAGWQRDLSVSHEKIGDVQQTQGDLAAALTSYRASLAIAEKLARADPDNAEWQRDLIVSCWRIADADPKAAPAMFARALDIAKQLQSSGKLVPADAWIPHALARRLAELTAANPARP